MADSKIKLGEAVGKLREVLVDLTSLTVETWTGDLSAVLQQSGTGQPPQVNWGALSATVQESPAVEGQPPVRTLTYGGDYALVAATRVALDHDSWNFQSSKAVDPAALALHAASLDAALKGRAALVSALLGLAGRAGT